MKQQRNYTFINWGKNIRQNVANYYQPETEEEIQFIIKKHDKIRVVGTGHSWSAVCVTDDTMINLDQYNKVLHLDKEQQTIKVQAGIKLHQLNKFLDKEGLALQNLGSISEQSLAGAISTGTHGSGITYQCLASQIIELSLIKADGSKIIIHKEEDVDLFNATVISIGCLGVISEITLQVTQCFNLHEYTTTLPFDEVIENIDELLQNNHHFKLWWLPPTNEVVVYKYRRTQEKINDSKLRQFFQDRLLSVLGYRLLVFIGRMRNSWIVAINKYLTKQMHGPIDRIEKCYNVYNVPAPPIHRETEWTFDLVNVKEMLRAYKKMVEDSPYHLTFIQEIRFTKGDDFWLSPCYKRDAVWLGLYNYDFHKWNEILPFYQSFAKQYNGRPHWGKEFVMDKNYLQNQYEKIEDFKKLKHEFDPAKKFENKFVEELFG